MTRSPTLQLKKPASIICELEGEDRCGQWEKLLFRTCLRVSTSTSVLGRKLLTVVSVFSLFNGCSPSIDAADIGLSLLVVDIMISLDGNIERTTGQVGLRCLWIVNGCMSDVQFDTSIPHV